MSLKKEKYDLSERFIALEHLIGKKVLLKGRVSKRGIALGTNEISTCIEDISILYEETITLIDHVWLYSKKLNNTKLTKKAKDISIAVKVQARKRASANLFSCKQLLDIKIILLE